MFKKAIDYINGFKLIENNIELADEPKRVVPGVMVVRAINIIDKYKLKNVRFGLREFSVSKLPPNQFIKYEIEYKKQCKRETKSEVVISKNGIKCKFYVLSTAISLGLDNKLWKFEAKTYFTYTCRDKIEINDLIQSFCIDYANLSMYEIGEFDYMLRYPISFLNPYKLKKVDSKEKLDVLTNEEYNNGKRNKKEKSVNSKNIKR